MKLWRNDGSLKKYHHEIIGRKARMDNLQAAVLNVKLKYLDDWNKKRLENARLYNELLRDIKEINLPLLESEKIQPVFHLYTIFTNHRDKLQEYLSKNEISTGIHYPVPIHLQPAYKHLSYKENDFPVAEALSKQELSLPMFPELKKEEIEFVCQRIRDYFRKE